MIQASDLTYRASEGDWFAILPDENIEIHVRGNQDHPDQACLSIANQAIADMDSLLKQTDSYLRWFVDFSKLKSSGIGGAQWLEFGISPQDSTDEFRLFFCVSNDDYGIWSIRFRWQGDPFNRFFPCEFGRREW